MKRQYGRPEALWGDTLMSNACSEKSASGVLDADDGSGGRD